MKTITAEEFKRLPDGVIFSSSIHDQMTVKGDITSDTNIPLLVHGQGDWDEPEYHVWEKADIEALIQTLSKALAVAP